MSAQLGDYEQRKAALAASLRAVSAGGLRLAKNTSNLFRDRKPVSGPRLDARAFDHVLEVDPAAGHVEVEGMTSYGELTAACLAQGVMPAVVPQLKSITIGGAVSGVGVESSSFRYGLVHETVQELEVLLADGSVVSCTPDNEHRDLLYGLPNSYGTLGYVLKLKAKVVPVRPFVRLTHLRFTDSAAYFAELGRRCAGPADFVDGTIFGPGEYFLSVGEMVDAAPYTSDYGFEHIYYRSIRERQEDYLGIHDYLWRWDTDWFWCSKNLGVQNPLVRRLLGRKRLNSVTYTKIMRWNSRLGLARGLDRLRGLHCESVIQDVDVPLPRCAEFLAFYFDTIRFTPVWICPIGTWDPQVGYDLYPMDRNTLYVNFGFWDVIREHTAHPPGHYNRLVERKVTELGGIKSLYSDSYYPPEEFWEIYNWPAYRRLKQKYDPQGRLKDLYAKCVLRE